MDVVLKHSTYRIYDGVVLNIEVTRQLALFFGPAGKIVDRRLPPTMKRETVSDFYSLKTPAAPSFAPGARSTVSRLNG